MKIHYKIALFAVGLLVSWLVLTKTTMGNQFLQKLSIYKIQNHKKQKRTTVLKKSKYDLKHLSPEAYNITQNEGTEAPFANKYWDNKEEGIYVDAVSGKALFSSKDKYDSGSGWPSFTKPIDANEVESKTDNKLGVTRTEIHSQSANTHLGHVFNDGPAEKGGKRFCVNSASLKFIPLKQMTQKAYQKYLKLFTNKQTKTLAQKDLASVAVKKETATLAGGCFWGVEHLLKNIPGVLSSQAGYTGGTTANPSYSSISTGTTNHVEAVQIVFDVNKISYQKILSYFWRLHNPTELNKQGPDVGTQYRSVIFYHSEKQKDLAQTSLIQFDKSAVFKKKVVTKIIKASAFYPAEEYHQDYYDKNPGQVCHALRKT